MASFRGQQPLPSVFGTIQSNTTSGFWSIERVVALLTPLFSVGGGALFVLVGKLMPVHFSRSGFVAFFIAGATAAVSAALKWLHGRQKFVGFATDADQLVERVVNEVTNAVHSAGGPSLAEIEHMLQLHASSIIDAVGHAVGAPPSADDIARQIVQHLWPAPPAGQTPVAS